MGTWVATDVAYGQVDGAEIGVAAAVVFDGWRASSVSEEHTAVVRRLRPYVPGRFFERELPCLLAVLERLERDPDVILVDGYVWLAAGRPGLGAELHRALGGRIPVVGVAKTRFHSSDEVGRPVRRGCSTRPLYVTAIGMDSVTAAVRVEQMHGGHRLPTILKRADALGREVLGAIPQPSTTQSRPFSLAR